MKVESIEKKADRRKKSRFPFHRELRYKLLDDGVLIGSGNGYALNMSSGGVAFTVDDELKEGTLIELSISWPVQLEDACPMRIIVFGRVVRSSGRQAACTIDKYEFRTQARTVTAMPLQRMDTGLLRWADGLRKESLKVRAMA